MKELCMPAMRPGYKRIAARWEPVIRIELMTPRLQVAGALSIVVFLHARSRNLSHFLCTIVSLRLPLFFVLAVRVAVNSIPVY